MRDDKGGEKEKPRFFEGLTYIHMVWVGELKVHAAASRMVPSIYGRARENHSAVIRCHCCLALPMPAANNIGLLYM